MFALRRLAPAVLPVLLAPLVLDGMGCVRRAPRTPNLLLVTVDTLRADHVGAYGAPAGLTPQLDAFAAQSLVFERAFAPASHTLPSVAALLTGREPEEVGVLSNRTVLPPGVPTLATLLWSGGHRTAAVVSNVILHRGAGLDAGFDIYDDVLPQRERNRLWPERVARDTTEAALARMDVLRAERDGPFFLWVHYQDPHGPYTPPTEHAEPDAPRPSIAAPDRAPALGITESGVGQIPSYQVLDRSRDPRLYRAAYAGEVRYVDAEIGRLLAGVRERGLWDETAILVTSDHGEGLGEDDYWFAHGEYLSEPLVRVPLLLRVPGRAPARSRSVVGLVDAAPTLLGLAGLPPPTHAVGRDLLAPAPEQRQLYQNALLGTLVPRLGLIEGNWQYRLSLVDGDRIESLHRLGDLQDHAADEPERMARLRDALRARRESLHIDHPPKVRKLPGEERALLRALGYVFED